MHLQNAPLPAIDADSSEEEEEQMTVDECIQDWYFYYTKSRASQFAYANYVKHFTKWLKEKYNRGITARLKTKHVKLYLVHRKTTMNQLRPVISVLKSLFKHMKEKTYLSILKM